MKKPFTMLMILDGFGMSDSTRGNAIAMAKTPNLDEIFKKYPKVMLEASGEAVGLPAMQMGNSEVGHLNIGAGRVVYQDLLRINRAIESGEFFENEALNLAMNGGVIHVFALLSDGGVHSHIDHVKAVLKLAEKRSVKSVYLHCFMDGRDTPPTSGIKYIKEIEEYIDTLSIDVKIGVISGRYYAMDRDKRYERLEKAYSALTTPKDEEYRAYSADEAVQGAYDRGETDEFIVPTVIADFDGIKDGDSIIFCNFRSDRAREITSAFVDPAFGGFARKRLEKLTYICMTEYDQAMPNVHLAFGPETMKNTLGEYVASLGLSQLRIAETEKYAHVTFFFNGGVETPNKNEDRILIPSPKVATYDLKPEMSAYEITDSLLKAIDSEKYDLIILNFANADMVGHTGVLEAAVKAIEALDECVKKIVDKALACDGQILLTADHGNADVMIDENGKPVTSHSLNPVPFVCITNSGRKFADEKFEVAGALSDIAPTILDLMGLEKPAEMTGKSLLK